MCEIPFLLSYLMCYISLLSLLPVHCSLPECPVVTEPFNWTRYSVPRALGMEVPRALCTVSLGPLVWSSLGPYVRCPSGHWYGVSPLAKCPLALGAMSVRPFLWGQYGP